MPHIYIFGLKCFAHLASLDYKDRRVFLFFFKGLGARSGSGQEPKIFMMNKKVEKVAEKGGGRRQKCSIPDEGDIIHQPILPIPPHYVKMYKKILLEEKLMT